MSLGFFVYGWFLTPIVPVLFSLACKVTYPCQPSIVTGLLFSVCTFYAAVFGISCAFVAVKSPESAIGMLAFSSLISFVAINFVDSDEPPHDLRYERLSLASALKTNESHDESKNSRDLRSNT
eukprot:CAMPEP_0116875732 /NCGR_PEP_ID=MMETSP0463-20121206/7796_1 /TAXON_ID=181622 /ORGANISM="Strombidinopsis sp, Strain SopsisLIS2011" /LENGTH=122 /DNA_ID=CAMNT_0004521875 /DNA_START=1062 /DNA_END=1427 /DNA_ORIENTATION=+